MKREIKLENVGPIERLAIPLPDAGVVVLRGRNGVGKSHALAAVDSLVGGRGRPPCRDGARKGIVEGAGAKISIGRSTRRTGEAEVVTLEGRLDISQLVQPPIKDEESADRTRIKALIQLSGASADPSAFASILPDGAGIGELVGPGDLNSDPVALAGKLKRALEAEARRHEKAADDYAAKAAACQQQAGEFDASDLSLRREDTEVQLQEALVRLKELQTQASEAAKRQQQIAQAREHLERLRAEEPADQSIAGMESELESLDSKIQQLEKALAVAHERRQQVRRQLERARVVQSQVQQLESIIAEAPETVSESQLADAEQAVAEARAQHHRAIEVERVRQLAKQASTHREAANQESAAADHLRFAAHATDDVLTDLVARVTKRLRVEEGRLVCDTDRGAEPFSELSPGERWRLALEIAAEQVGRGGMVTVPQEAWESLDPTNRREIAQIARDVGVVILTAEASDEAQIAAEVV